MEKRKNVKAKGNRGEREIGKKIVDVYNQRYGTDMKYDVDVKKMPSSGAYRLDGFRGDLLILNPEMFKNLPFTIEIKSYKDVKLDDIFSKNYSSIIFKSIDQNEGSLEPDTTPLQIIKKDRGNVYCVFRDLTLTLENKIEFVYKDYKYTLCLFQDFFKAYFADVPLKQRSGYEQKFKQG